MKAVLEFDLPQEEPEHRAALDGAKWMSVCSRLDEWLRSQRKHADRDSVTVEEARTRLREEMDAYGLRFE